MKLNENTVVPKIMTLKSEIETCQKAINQIKDIMHIENSLEFAKKLQELIENMPKLNYLSEEMESIKESIIDVYDGYETRNESLKYMNFMQRVMINSLDYLHFGDVP